MKQLPRSSRGRASMLAVLMILGAALGTTAGALGQDRARPPAPAPGGGGAAGEDTARAEGSERSEGGQKVKVLKFSGFDISGRLKSPQLLYFLNRLRAEFERPRLPHKTFLPEVERSTRSGSGPKPDGAPSATENPTP